MKYNDLSFDKLKNKLPEDTKAVLFYAMDIFYNLKNKDAGKLKNEDDMTILSLYLSMLRLPTRFKEAMQQNGETNDLYMASILKSLNIELVENLELDAKTYSQLYKKYFQDIIYNIYFMSNVEYDPFLTKDFTIEYLAYYIHDSLISGSDTINRVLTGIDPSKEYLDKSSTIATQLLNDLYGIYPFDTPFYMFQVPTDSHLVVTLYNSEDEKKNLQNNNNDRGKILQFKPKNNNHSE